MQPFFIKMDSAELMRLAQILEADYLETGDELTFALFEKTKAQLKELANQRHINYQFFSRD